MVARFGKGYIQVRVGGSRSLAALACPNHESNLKKIRLDHILERVAFLSQRGCQGFDSGGSAVVDGDDRSEKRAIEFVKPQGVDLLDIEGVVDTLRSENPIPANLGEVAYAFEQSVGHPGRTTASGGNDLERPGLSLQLQLGGRPPENRLQLLG